MTKSRKGDKSGDYEGRMEEGRVRMRRKRKEEDKNGDNEEMRKEERG